MTITFIVDLIDSNNTLLSPQEALTMANTKTTLIPLGLTGTDNIIFKHGHIFTLEGAQAVHLRRLIESGQVGGVIKILTIEPPVERHIGVQVIEDFNHSVNFTLAFPDGAIFQPSHSASHEGGGDYGLINYPGNDWIFRTTPPAIFTVDNTISVWLKFVNMPAGEASFSFGARRLMSGFADRTYALLVNADTNELKLIQQNWVGGFPGTRDILSSDFIPTTLTSNKWYHLNVRWIGIDHFIGELLDSDGVSIILRINAHNGTYGFTNGSFGFHKSGPGQVYWDTIEISPPIN